MNLLAMKRQSVPLHAEIAALLRNQIHTGELAPGEQLPPLSVLTKDMGVARMTIRQAMDTLESEGLIERHAGRGTFVKKFDPPARQTMKMRTDLSQLHSMVADLEVTVSVDETQTQETEEDGVAYRCMKRIHSLGGKPFCYLDLRVATSIYELAPQRFSSEIVISLLKEMGIPVHAARQRMTISYADFESAQVLDIKVNSPVFKVFREFFGSDGKLVYSANLTYPGDALEFNIEFEVDPST